MALKIRLIDDLKRAMREGDVPRRNTIRLMRAAIANAEQAKRSAFVDRERARLAPGEELNVTVADADFELDDAEVIRVLQKEAKQRQDAIAEYRKGGRADLVAQEEIELAVIQEYLPRQLSREEIVAQASEAIAEAGAQGPAQLGLVMKTLMPRLQGRADGRVVNEVVRELLSKQTNDQ
jgi:uncharacterized protein YqeY